MDKTLTQLALITLALLMPFEMSACPSAFLPDDAIPEPEGNRSSSPDIAAIFRPSEAAAMMDRYRSIATAYAKEIDAINATLDRDQAMRSSLFWRWFGTLSQKDIKNLVVKKDDLATEIENMSRKVNDLDQQYANELREKLSQSLKNNALRPLANDMFNFLWIQKLNPEATISLTLGNTHRNPSRLEVDETTKLALELTEKGYKIIYDADSRLAPAIARAAGKNGVGVSAAPRGAVKGVNHSRAVLYFHNPYLKLAALNHAGLRIAGPNSLAGISQVVFEKATLVFDPEGRWPEGLSHWERHLDRHGIGIGLRFRSLSVYSSVDNLYLEQSHLDEPFPQRAAIADLSLKELEHTVQYIKEVGYDARTISASAGAVVFGSSGLHRRFIDQTYEISKKLVELGQPVVTGGAGGMMLVANMAAHDAGGTSIGIPIAGRNQLSRETRVFNEFHSHTIPVSGYASRVGLLVQNREFIVIVPGRSGTMREVATALVMLGADPGRAPTIVFVNSEYYQPLYSWLTRDLGLSPAFLDKVVLVDNPNELEVEIERRSTASRFVPTPQRAHRASFPYDEYKVEGP